jgi:dTDP-3-amino-3,4,6-trideoxy-alpha-D-glucose transaminase
MTQLLNGARAIPLTRMDNADPELLDELLAAVERVARSGGFTGGAEVDAFEAELADYCGTRHAVGLSSGTEALALALRALEIGPGDEVIVPANSFIATAEAVTLVGATPRFVDVDPDTALVTADLVEPAINSRTRCVIPVHLYGRTVDLDPIVALARRAGIAVIEDACQAHGAWLGSRRAGSVGDCAAFSFYPAKNLGAWGDAGGLVTSDDTIADRVRLLRSHGERPRYNHLVPGTTARLDALQAAVLRIKLGRLDGWNDGRRRVAAVLSEALAGAPVDVPAPVAAGGDHVFHQFVVGVDDRDALRSHLERHGIATGIHYPVAIHRSQAYASAGLGPGSLPVAERLADRICSLPMHFSLTDDEIARVAAAVHGFADELSRAA